MLLLLDILILTFAILIPGFILITYLDKIRPGILLTSLITFPLNLILIASLSESIISIPVTLFTTFTAMFFCENIISILANNIDQKILDFLFIRFPVTFLNIFGVGAANGFPGALNKISEKLRQFPVEQQLSILNSSPHTLLSNLAYAATNGNPKALNAISNALSYISKDELFAILKNAPETLFALKEAATKGNLEAYTTLRSRFFYILEEVEKKGNYGEVYTMLAISKGFSSVAPKLNPLLSRKIGLIPDGATKQSQKYNNAIYIRNQML